MEEADIPTPLDPCCFVKEVFVYANYQKMNIEQSSFISITLISPSVMLWFSRLELLSVPAVTDNI